MAEAKPYTISKQVVWEAYQKVKANQGAAGVDGQSIEAFESDLKNNLYKIWNRMSSGSYFPPPVRLVEIPKATGGLRPLGIPTVADRVAQMVVKRHLEPLVEPHFHADSYGYRPGKSALDAVATARQRCWRSDWVIDLDIKGFFDNLDHDLVMKAVRHHDKTPWVLLYIERWLKAIRARLAECGLELHPEKTKIVYCQDSDRKGQHEHIQFDFLGYTFRPRRAKNYRGKPFVSFLAGVSNKAGKAIRTTIRGWRLAATRNNQPLEDLARLVNPSVSGWVNYYGRFYRSALTPVLRHLERALIRWACRKYKRFRGHVTNAAHWLGRVARRDPHLFVLWRMGIRPATGS